MKEDAVLFSGLSFCCAYATATTAADSSAETAAAAVKTTVVSGLSCSYSAAAVAAETASAKSSVPHKKLPSGSFFVSKGSGLLPLPG